MSSAWCRPAGTRHSDGAILDWSGGCPRRLGGPASRGRSGRVRGRRRPRRPVGAPGRRTGPARAPLGGGSPGGRSVAARMASSARSSPSAPSAATAASRTSGVAGTACANSIRRPSTSPATASCSPHAHAAISTTVASGSPSARRQVDRRGAAPPAPPPAGAPPRRDRRAAERAGRRRARRAGRGRRARPPAPLGRRRPGPGAPSSRRRCARPARRSLPVTSLLEQVGERGHDPRQAERRHGRQHRADDDRQPGAGDHRPHPAQRARRPGTAERPPRAPGRARGAGFRSRLRGRFGCALAVLRHPASSRRHHGQAGDPGHPNGEIVDRHAGRHVNPGPPARGGHRPRAARPCTARGRSRSSCSPSLVLLTIGRHRRCSRRASSPTRRSNDPDDPAVTVERGHPLRPHPAIGAAGRRSRVVRRARGRRRARRGSRGRHLLRHHLRAAAVGAVVVGRRRPDLRTGRRLRRRSRRSTSSPASRSSAARRPTSAGRSACR